MSDDAPRLADGIDAYIARFKANQSAGPAGLAQSRLASDMAADLFSAPDEPSIRRFTTFIVEPGREIAVRIYHRGGSDRPGVVYCHGGGFLFGSIDSFDSVAVSLARVLDAVVVSVQYRRLPENCYAAAQTDCEIALDWAIAHADRLGIDPARMVLAGDSVGAMLATVTASRASARGVPLAAQLLLYGAYAFRPGAPAYAASRDPLLDARRVEAFISAWAAADGPSHHPAPLDMPLAASLPPAVMLAAEHDPLLDESLAYAARLSHAGVAVSHRIASGMIHGFMRAVGMSRPVADEFDWLADALSPHLSQTKEPR